MVAITSLDLHKAVNTVWDAGGLETLFQANWSASDITQFVALQDTEGMPAQPFPYCVSEQGPGSTTSRMSGHDATENHEIRDIPWSFRVHAKQVTGISQSPKQIAGELVAGIMAVFGGHPTISPTALTLESAAFLIAQYQTDWGIKTGDAEYEWIVNYLFRIDSPVAI